MRYLIKLLILFTVLPASAQILENKEVHKLPHMDASTTRDVIHIPDILGFKTLKCDFHIHTVFSDGEVWPTVRIDEAWNNGLDAIALTDHIEYRPKKNILKGDLNESYKIAKKRADEIGFLLIKGIEITRSKPIGHLNALFIEDAIPLDVKDPIDAVNAANRQGAFVMWNHPGWPDDKCTLYPVHKKLIEEKKIHGVETFNHLEYYPISFDWCKEMNLAFMSNSDVHHTIAYRYGTEKNVRPMTLVFATDHSVEGIKEALFAGRSVAYFNGQMAGPDNLLRALLSESLDLRIINPASGLVEIMNLSDIPYVFKIKDQLINIPINKCIRMQLPIEGELVVLNCQTGSDTYLTLALPLVEL